MDKFEDRVRITGMGTSRIGRKLGIDPIALAVDACLAAIADAGLTRADIDGIATHGGGRTANGYAGAGIADVQETLRLAPRWFQSGYEMPGQGGAVVNAMMAVAAGLCRHALVFRSTWESSAGARASGLKDTLAVEGETQWMVSVGAFSAANWIAIYADRHFAHYGTRREHLGSIAVSTRANAARNPAAIYREPLTMDDYLGARMISEPFGLYDCDVPCDGAVAFVVSAADAARDCRRPDPLRIEAVGTRTIERWSWDQGDLLHEPLIRGACDHMWSRTDLKPADVRTAQLYDGFTFNCLCWIELLGFCGEGEGGPFVEGGSRIALDGALPLNTGGGQLSGGRLHGYGHIHEACVQLWGEGGERQVAGDPNVAVATTGGGAPGGVLLLVRD